MSTSSFDEDDDLRALFAEVEPPASLEDRWRSRAALTELDDEDVDEPGTEDAEVVPLPRRLRRPQSWVRVVAAGAAAIAAASVIALVATNRLPPSPTDSEVLETVSETPTEAATTPAPTTTQPSPATGPSETAGAPGQSPGNRGTGRPVPPVNPGTKAPAPARGPLTEWPDATNTGLPSGTNLAAHVGDLHVTTPGEIVADRRVTGTVYIEAPDVTLRRVLVDTPDGAVAGVRQQAPRLRIEDSEISGSGLRYGVQQESAGLTVRRSHVHGSEFGVAVTDESLIVDSLLATTGSEVYSTGGASQVTLRHNTIAGVVEVIDDTGAVTDLTVEKNQLDFIKAPGREGSRDIRVTANQFHRDESGSSPVSGWNAQAPGNAWTDNVWFGTTEPAVPSP